MIPEFEVSGNLPPGVYQASWAEVVGRFGFNARRQRLLSGLLRAIKALKLAGCRRMYLDGSFVTSKDNPGDFDACWDTLGVDASKLDPVLLTFDNGRASQKAKYYGEMFPARWNADSSKVYLEFFQQDSQTGESKGIIELDLGASDYD